MNIFKKQYNKFKNKSWFGKITDLLFICIIILLIIPSTRRELRTYGAKVRMYLTSVEENEQTAELTGSKSVVFRDTKGNQYTLNNFLDKPVFMNFWATWCPPCRAEMPTIEKLYEQYGDQVHFLIISDQPLSKQQDFLSEYGYDLPVYKLTARPSGSFSYSVLPTSMIISEDNKIILRKEGAINWNSKKVQNIFKNL